jgi:hypothetical protein
MDNVCPETGNVKPMNATIALGALLLLASIVTAPSVAAEPPAVEEDAQCTFITLAPFFPFVVIDWDCPPVNDMADGF